MKVDCFLSSIDYAAVNTDQDAVGAPCWQGTLLAHVQLTVCQDSQVPFSSSATSLSLPSLHQCNGLLSPKYSTSYLFLQNCMKFLPAYSSGSLMPIWMEILFSKVQVVLPTLMQLSFTSAANLMSMHQLHHLSDD